MDDRRVGRLVRAVRQRRNLRQSDLARQAGTSQKTVSEIELGRVESVRLVVIRRVATALDVSISLDAWWRGGEADRLVDRAHASLVEAVAAYLVASGWEVIPEFSFNVYGDRGSVDILAWHPGERILLVVEVKSLLTDLQETLSTMSKKTRVVPGFVESQTGWRPLHVAKLIVVADTRANRSVVARHAATFDAAFPARSREVRTWLRSPSGSLGGLWFLSSSGPRTAMTTARARVRRRRAVAGDRGS